jgi:hypothetical protein
MGRVGCRDSWGRDEVQVFRVWRGAAGPDVGAHQRHRLVDHHRFGVRDPRLTVDPDRHACSGQGLDTVCRRARRGLVGDQPNMNPTSLGADQRLDDARTGCQAIGTNQDLALGVVDRTDREGGTVFLRGEADRDHSARCDRSSRQRGGERAINYKQTRQSYGV